MLIFFFFLSGNNLPNKSHLTAPVDLSQIISAANGKWCDISAAPIG